jgi:hypothetical protein
MAEEQGHKNEMISDADEKLGQIADMIKDACAKFDSVSSRMDSMEERMEKYSRHRKDDDDDMRKDSRRKDDDDCMGDDDRMDDARKDAKRKDGDESFKKWAEQEAKEPEHQKDSKCHDDDDDMEVMEPGKPMETAADRRRKDAEEVKEEGDHRVADSNSAEIAALRREIAALNRRAPAIMSDIDRERFAAIQEDADPAFQAFGDRAPAPLSGETPIQYKRRLGAKLQANSPKWSKARLSAVADDAMLDTILADVYADSIAAARAGADVMPGHLREVSRQAGGHIINEFVGEPSSWMGGFVGRVNRAGGVH